MGVYKYLNVGRDVQELDSGKKITLLLGFALVNKIWVAFVSLNCEIHLLLQKLVNNGEKLHENMIFFCYRSKII